MAIASLVLAATLDPGGLIAWLIVGVLAGWLAGIVMPGHGFGFIGDMVVGLIGAFLGGLLVDVLAPSSTFGFWGSLFIAIIGACVLVAILHAVTRNRGAVL